MRAIALLVMISAPAFAEPKKKKVDLPDVVKEATDKDKLTEHPGTLGIGGKLATGVIIVPKKHPDAEPAPFGGWIVPPDVNDPIALEPGTNQLRNRIPRTAWLPRDLSRAFKAGADKVWDVVLPKL